MASDKAGANGIRERVGVSFSGWAILPMVIALGWWGLQNLSGDSGAVSAIFNVALIIVAGLMLTGLFIVEPNEAKVLQFMGTYIGSVHKSGLRWTFPFVIRRSVSLRVRNFESAKLKVNDAGGNPIEIAAIVVWRVTDSVEALFEVDNFETFIKVQSESAVRNLAMQFHYDSRGNEREAISLHGNPDHVSAQLKKELQDRLNKAGVSVIEARLSHLAYAPEIAATMLQRQQADAIISARQKIVEGAVGMVKLALDHLNEGGVVELDEEKKATMVSNLLVVLCSERSTQPIVNAGSIY